MEKVRIENQRTMISLKNKAELETMLYKGKNGDYILLHETKQSRVHHERMKTEQPGS